MREKRTDYRNRKCIDPNNVYRYIVQRELISNECCGVPALPTGSLHVILTDGEVLEKIFMRVYTSCTSAILSDTPLKDFLILQRLTLTNLNVLSKSITNKIPATLPPTSEMLFIYLDNKNQHTFEADFFPEATQDLLFTYEFNISPLDAITPVNFAVSTFFKIRTV